MSESRSSLICDAGPLIHLDEMDCLHLLTDFEPILIPDQVWQEVVHHRPDALSLPDLSLQRKPVEISSTPAFSAMVRTFSLDLGEQAALSLMALYPDALFLTDDAAARLAAMTMGFKVHGTIGVLIRAIRRNQLGRDDVLSLLSDLPVRSTLHIRPTLLQTIIDKLKG